jgi:REP element-mobilizing transposase RayT
MPQSLACLHVHLIFSTKDRANFLSNELREELHAYMATVLQNLECHAVIINSMPDHIHLLVDSARTLAISDLVKNLKTTSSRWIKARKFSLRAFAWQSGYAAFAVSVSNLKNVRKYIANQAEHHKARSFQDEYRAFLNLHGVEFDERYAWD